MNFTIDNTNTENIEKSFDRIAKELLSQKVLYVNGIKFRFTEIEFYYFYPEVHEDNYTHKHKRSSGQWRFHNQGIDITLQGNEISDGGILIRGVTSNGAYINGPINSLKAIFEAFGNITDETSFVIKNGQIEPHKIIKTFRHLPNKVTNKYNDKYYRYLVELDELKIQEKIKTEIRNNHFVL